MRAIPIWILTVGLTVGITCDAATGAHDPGPRTDGTTFGPLEGLTPEELTLFEAGSESFQRAKVIGDGLGPRFNLDRCSGCHSQPGIGGASPSVNPQVAIGTAFGARNRIPSFVRHDGPIVEARFKKRPDGTVDGGVHSLFVIRGRVDASGDATTCAVRQDDFDGEFAKGNVSLRIPVPTFGSGLVEAIADKTISANLQALGSQAAAVGISGRPNRNSNTGTIGRFGWKAQIPSLLMFSGEAYNVESGITNEVFQTERDETPSCQFAPVPNDSSAGFPPVNHTELFAFFMKFLAAPIPSPNTPGGSASIQRGSGIFYGVGCVLCHWPTLQTSNFNKVAALQAQDVHLYSDLLLHNMGPNLADDIVQGDAAGDEFRTPPLWGLGQRIFFLHDGRTTDLIEAINAHQSAGDSRYGPSEANQVIGNFQALPDVLKQDLLNFLRSL